MNRATGLVLARIWMNLCGIAAFFLIGHFLGPAEFGFFALASSLITLPTMVAGAGYTEHVIGRDPERRDEATAFWSSGMMGLAGTGLIALIALVSAVFFKSPLAEFLWWFAILPAAWGFTIIREATLIRDNRGHMVLTVQFLAETVGFIALFIALTMKAGIYALIAGRLANAAVGFLGYVLTARVRLSGFEPDRAMTVGRYSLGIMGTRLVGWFDNVGMDLMIGVALTAAAVGQFRMGLRLLASATSITIEAPNAAQVAYLGERKAKGPAAFSRAAVRSGQLHLAVVTPIFVAISVLAPDIIALFLPPRWAQAGQVLAVFAVSYLIIPYYYVANNVLTVAGRSAEMFRYRTASTIFMAVCFALAVSQGPVIAAIVRSLSGLPVVYFTLVLAREISPQSRARLFRAAGVIAIAGAAMWFAMAGLRAVTPGEGHLGLFLRMAGVGLAGLAVYIVTLQMVGPATARVTLHNLKKFALRVGARFGPRPEATPTLG